MRANVIPAATLVSIAVFANEEVVPNVAPAPIVHVEVLVRSNDHGARLLVHTVFRYTTMMDHYIRRRCDRQNLKIETLPGLPFASVDDSRTLWIAKNNPSFTIIYSQVHSSEIKCLKERYWKIYV